MATIAELNIRLGLLTKGFDRELRGIERKLQQSASRMGVAGEQLSLAVTVPLLGIGAAAIKVAGEFESLRLAMTATLESVGRGAFEAASEVLALQKIALAPGIDFEQAVRGSVRLQGVGISAEKARLIIKELGNQIASSGGTAKELDAVTRQFTQIIGKGRILQEDLTIILENMPSLARVLRDEFGTSSADALRDLGVSAEDFVDRLTNRMATVPRAAGGIANSIVNAGVAIRTALAKIGETLNSTFNVTGALDAFSTWVVDLADRFANLDAGTQQAIIGIGVFVVALGPAIKLMSLITSGAVALVGTFARVAESFRLTAIAGTGTLGVFSRLNTAMKLSLFVGAAGVVLALAAAIATLSAASGEASESSRIFSDAQKTVNEEVGRETAVLNKNFDVLKSTTATTEQRTAAIKELQATYPQYLRNVGLESASLTELTEIQGQLNSQILKGVAERQKAIAIEGQYNKVAQAQLRITQLRQQGFEALSGEEVKASGRSLFGTEFEKGFVSAGAKAKVVADVIKQLEGEIKGATKTATELTNQFDTAFGIGEKASKKSIDAAVNQRTALEALKDKMEDMKPAQRAALEFSKEWDDRWEKMKSAGGGSFDGASASAKLYAKALASIAAVAQKGDVLGADVMSEQAREIESQIEKLIENGFKPYSKQIQHLRGMLKDLRADMAKGFETPNVAQQTLGIGVEASTLPTLDVPDQVVRIDTTSAQDSLTALQGVALKGIETAAEYKNSWELFGETMRAVSENLIPFNEQFDALGASILETLTPALQALGGVAISAFDGIAQSVANGATTFKTFAQTIANSVAPAIGELIKLFVAKLIANSAFATANPLAAIALGGIAAALGTALFKRAVGAAKLAKGGVIDEPTLALIGEYPGAKTNPEIVTPENKLRDVFTEVMHSFSFSKTPVSLSAPTPDNQTGMSEIWERLFRRGQFPDVQPVRVDVNVTGQIGHDAIYLANTKEAERRSRYG